MEHRIVAVGLLTQRNLDVLGNGLSQCWPVEEAPSFNELLRAIDEADERLQSGEASARPDGGLQSERDADSPDEGL